MAVAGGYFVHQNFNQSLLGYFLDNIEKFLRSNYKSVPLDFKSDFRLIVFNAGICGDSAIESLPSSMTLAAAAGDSCPLTFFFLLDNINLASCQHLAFATKILFL